MKRKILISLISFFLSFTLFSQHSIVRQALATAPKTKDVHLIYNHLLKHSQKAISLQEKKEIFIFLSEYAMKCHLFNEAGNAYLNAFNASFVMQEGECRKYLVKALKSFILSGSIEESYATYGKLKAMRNKNLSVYDAEGDLYIQYLHLAESISNPAIEINEVIKNLKTYSKEPLLKDLKPSILLTLWFIQDDAWAEKELLSKYPLSMEAMLVKGGAIILPTTFWYLLPTTKAYYEEDGQKAQNNDDYVELSVAKAYQIGFFKQKEHALKQMEKLKGLGFVVEMKEEKRKDSSYYTVFVLEKENGRTGLRLKDKGFESFPIFD